MKVFWSYADYRGRGSSDLREFSAQKFFMIASVLSWEMFAPNIERVFYVDHSTLNLLEQLGITKLYHQIIEVDFQKELHEKYSTEFFAYPKIWGLTQQTSEPCFMVDTDCILTGPLTWMDPTEYYAELYEGTNFLTVDVGPLIPKVTKEDLDRFSQYYRIPGVKSFCDLSRCLNGNFIYFADPQVAQIAGYTLLGIFSGFRKAELEEQVARCEDISWKLWEEGSIRNLIEKVVGRPMKQIPEGNVCQFTQNTNLSSISEICEKLEKMLNIPIREWYFKDVKRVV